MNEAQPLNALPPGYRLQEYELVRVLGFGGFGMTYLGFDHNLDKAVAIKEYLPSDIAIRTGDNSVTPQATQFQEDFAWGLARFLDEARVLARFDHRHIIKVYRFFEAHGTAYIVMEYAEGETLSEFLHRKGTLNEAELKAILYPLLDGLEVVHGADFLHRDIKPGNIIIRHEDGSPVLLDFGAARQAIGSRSRSVTTIITPGYAPIEQYSGRGNQGSWTDIYALGGVCYRALTGEVPDDATDRVRNDPLVPLVERCAGRASAGFLVAIDRALSVDEGDRPQSIGEWRVALGEETPRIVDTQPSVPAPAPQAEKQRQEEVFVAKVDRKPSALGTNNKGETDLHVVAGLNLDMIAVSLLDQGADVHLKNNYGDTPLHVAASTNADETAEVLLDRGADVQAKANDGSTPLHIAASNNAGETAEVLLKYGADVRAKNKYGGTPLDVATATDAREIAKLLLKHGAGVWAKANDGGTPLPIEKKEKRTSGKLLAVVLSVVYWVGRVTGVVVYRTTEQKMGGAFLDLVNRGEARWTRYVLTLLIIIALWVLGSGAVLFGVYGSDPEGSPLDGTNPFLDFIALNLFFVTVLIGLWIGICNAHKRSLRTLITPRNRIRWGRVFQGFGLQMGLGMVVTAIETLLFPGTHTYTLDPDRFYKFALLVLILTPFQTTTEELLMRSYLLQMLGHMSRHPMVLILLNALLFALLHGMNPEIAAHGAIPMMAYYFVSGAFLALVTLKDNGAELAIGIHAANNVFAGIFVGYTGAALKTNPVFTAEVVNVWFALIAYTVSAWVMYTLLFRYRQAAK